MISREVALINPRPNLRKPDAAEPLSLLLLAGQLEQAGLNPVIIDEAVLPITSDLLSKYHVFGVTATTSQYSRAKSILSIIREVHSGFEKFTQVIGGGPHFTVTGEKSLRDGWDTVIAGDGDLDLSEVIVHETAGLVKGRREENLDVLAFPARHLVDNLAYSREGEQEPSISVLTMRGCPFSCIYCAREVMGRKVRFRSPEKVVAEISQVIELNPAIHRVVFYDDTFTVDENRTLELSRLLEPLNIKWICNTRINRVTSKSLAAMKKAGCEEISFGLESADQRVSNQANKGINVSEAGLTIKMVRDSGIKSRVFFMFGFPEDSWQSVEANLKFLNEFNPDAARLSLLIPLPGTEIYNRAEKYGMDLSPNTDDYYYAGPDGPHTFIRKTNHLSEKEFPEAIKTLFSGFAAWATHNGSVRVTNIKSE